jgi:SAM-dependent methyltransferase
VERRGPEISDVVVDYDPKTLARRPIALRQALEQLGRVPNRARRIVRRLPVRGGIVEDEAVDGMLLRAHLELQRLHEEFRIGPEMRAALVPLVGIVRAHVGDRRIRVVDLGCGLGFVLRWLAAHGGFGDDIELLGVDYNRTLIASASRLATQDRLRCKFAAANAFALREPADIIISTGVLHHFRGDGLVRVFGEHEQSRALGFVHLDIRPSWVASLGSWIFHLARMREPLARFDGYWSAVRAHTSGTLCGAAGRGAPSFALATLDERFTLRSLVQIMHGIIGVRRELEPHLAAAYRAFGPRLERV